MRMNVKFCVFGQPKYWHGMASSTSITESELLQSVPTLSLLELCKKVCRRRWAGRPSKVCKTASTCSRKSVSTRKRGFGARCCWPSISSMSTARVMPWWMSSPTNKGHESVHTHTHMPPAKTMDNVPGQWQKPGKVQIGLAEPVSFITVPGTSRFPAWKRKLLDTGQCLWQTVLIAEPVRIICIWLCVWLPPWPQVPGARHLSWNCLGGCAGPGQFKKERKQCFSVVLTLFLAII